MSIAQAISRPVVRRPTPSVAKDAELIERVRDGDERAFEAIFKAHHAPLLAYARHMLGNQEEAEDALQQAFIRTHKALLGGTVPRELRPWLYAVVRNCCLSAIAARRPVAELEDHAGNLVGLCEEVREREDLRELLADIGRLPEDQRSALLLAELDDLSHQSIATIVGCPVSKVKALIYQARSTLIADRQARNTSCREIREELAVARAGQLRRGPLRRHLSLCVGCRDFQRALATQSAGLAAKILSHTAVHAAGGLGQAGALGSAVTPAGALTGAGTATGTAASGAGAAATGGTTSALLGGGVAAKVAVGGAVAVLATAGAVTTVHRLARPHHRHPAQAHVHHTDKALSGARAPSPPALQLAAVSTPLAGAGASEMRSATLAGEPALPGALTEAATQTLSSSPSPAILTEAIKPSQTDAQPAGGGSSASGAAGAQHRRKRLLERPRLQRDRRLGRLRKRRLAQRRKLAAHRRSLVEQRRRAREERQLRARELREAREQRERLRQERQRKARELQEAKERRELEAQREREQRTAATSPPQTQTQTTQSTSETLASDPTEAASATSGQATPTERKRKRARRS